MSRDHFINTYGGLRSSIQTSGHQLMPSWKEECLPKRNSSREMLIDVILLWLETISKLWNEFFNILKIKEILFGYPSLVVIYIWFKIHTIQCHLFGQEVFPLVWPLPELKKKIGFIWLRYIWKAPKENITMYFLQKLIWFGPRAIFNIICCASIIIAKNHIF